MRIFKRAHGVWYLELNRECRISLKTRDEGLAVKAAQAHLSDEDNVCRWCGTKMVGRKRKYCSMDCKKKFYSSISLYAELRERESAANFNEQKLQSKECAYCGTLITDRRKKYCCGKCRRRFHEEMERYGRLRKSVIQENGGKCYFCSDEKMLHVHHVDGNGITKN